MNKSRPVYKNRHNRPRALLFAGAGLLAGILITATTGFAGPDNPQATARRSVLKNGLTIITLTDTASAITVVDIVVKGGSAAEPPGLAGVSYLTTRLAMDIPDEKIGRDFMIKALRNSMIQRDDEAILHLEFLTEFADSILSSFVGILADPLLTNIRIDRVTKAMEHQRRIQADDAVTLAGLAHRKSFFGGSGYAETSFGTEESLRAMGPKDVKEFFNSRFVAGNIIVVAVSDLAPDALRTLIERHFETLRPGRPDETKAEFSVKNPPYPEQSFKKEQQQSVVSCAYPLPGISRREYVLASLIEYVLGQGPGSRLWGLRTEQKLAYSVSCQAHLFRRAGFLEAYLETDSAKTGAAREALSAALKDFWERGISAEEFTASRAILWADFLRANETKTGRASTLGFFEAAGLEAEFFDQYSDVLSSLSLDEVNAEIKRLLDPKRASWVIVGPQK